jgi:hypothetical protein
MHAAVDLEHLTCDVTRSRSAKEDCGVGDVVGLACMPERHCGRLILADECGAFGAEAIAEPARLDIARADRIHANFRRKRPRQRQRHGVERAF